MNDNGPPRDHVVEDAGPQDETPDTDLAENVKSRSTWLRLLFMILFLALWSISRIVVLAVVILQFFWVLFTGATNERLGAFGASLATYTYQIILYLTYNTEEQPFPFTDWPSGPPGAGEE
jgi:hypothetical protein